MAIGGGGYVTGVYCHPTERNLVYIRTDVGGFYRWSVRTSRWIPLVDMFKSSQSNYYGGEGLALDPKNPNIVYIAAGKYTDSPMLGSIFKSENRGKTWIKLPINLPMGGNQDLRWGGERLEVSPFDSSIILFGSRTDGIWRSDDAGNHWRKVKHFFKNLGNSIGVTSIAFDPYNRGVVYAAVYTEGVYQSRDNGLHWKLTNGSPRNVQRLSVSGSGVLYATHLTGVSEYSKGKWRKITPSQKRSTYCGLAINPHNPDEILVSASSDHLQLYLSLDGGINWKRILFSVKSSAPWYSSSMREIQYTSSIAFDPCVKGRVWLTDWYATYVTNSISANKVVFSNHEKGHEELVEFSLASPPGGFPLLSGNADVDGFLSKSLTSFPDQGLGAYYGGTGPTYGDTEQIAWCALHPNNIVRAGLDSWNSTGGCAVSNNFGQSWKAVPSWNSAVMPGRIAISPTDPSNLVVVPIGNSKSQVTHNGGITWKPVSGLPVGIDTGVWYWNIPLSADGALPGVFYAVYNQSLYKSIDGGSRFKIVSTDIPGGFNGIESIPGRPGDLWIYCGVDGLLHSTDGGLSFKKVISVGQAELFSSGKSAARNSYPALYLYGTLKNGRQGIFRSLDAGITWQEIDNPLQPVGDVPNCMAGSWNTFGRVFIGTNGRGIYYGEPKR